MCQSVLKALKVLAGRLAGWPVVHARSAEANEAGSRVFKCFEGAGRKLGRQSSNTL